MSRGMIFPFSHFCFYICLAVFCNQILFLFSETLACASNPCLNNGTCIYVGGDKEYACKCQDAYIGDRCQSSSEFNKCQI